MTHRRRSTALAVYALLCGVLLLGTPRAAWAQSVTISLTASGDSISPAPTITVTAANLPSDVEMASLTLEASLEALFRTPFLVRSSTSASARFIVDSLLPQRTRVYFRARVIDRDGRIRAESVVNAPVRSWLRLVGGPLRTTDVLFTQTPTFAWSAPLLTLPPGPWAYTLRIINRAQNTATEFQFTDVDTVGVPRAPLSACTSYRWEVIARATNGSPTDQVVAASPGSFVIQTPECPLATILYQNFPNPFGRGEKSATTCFWFDLAHTSNVRLTLYDLRLRQVKQLVPGALGARLDAGAYGRQSVGDSSSSGCDSRLSWDGTDDSGRHVPAGVYIAVFTADGVRSTEKLLYRGQ
jgi:hypothetical protein